MVLTSQSDGLVVIGKKFDGASGSTISAFLVVSGLGF